MKASIYPSQLHLASESHQNPYAEYTAEMHDLFSHAMDRALGIQKASLAAVVKMQSDAIEMQKHVYEGEPALNSFSDLASDTFALCLEMQMTWLNLMVSSAQQGIEIWLHLMGMGMLMPATSAQPMAPMQMMSSSAADMAAA